MVRISNPQDYILDSFLIANDNKHKYIAILKHRGDGRLKKVPFGAIGYEQYHDKLGHYKELDHKDKDRKERWLKRHAKNTPYKFSSAWFSRKYLWD